MRSYQHISESKALLLSTLYEWMNDRTCIIQWTIEGHIFSFTKHLNFNNSNSRTPYVHHRVPDGFFLRHYEQKMSNDLLLLGWLQLPLRKSHHPITWRMLANFKWDSSTAMAGELDRWQQMGGNEQVALRVAEFGRRWLSSEGQALALELIDLSTVMRWITRTLGCKEAICIRHCKLGDDKRGLGLPFVSLRHSEKICDKYLLLYHQKRYWVKRKPSTSSRPNEELFFHASEKQSGRLSAHYAAQMSNVEYISVTFSP